MIDIQMAICENSISNVSFYKYIKISVNSNNDLIQTVFG